MGNRALKSALSFLVLSFVCGVAVAQQPPAPADVRDGSGEDIAYLRSTSRLSLNWDGVDWSGYEGVTKWYEMGFLSTWKRPPWSNSLLTAAMWENLQSL